MRARLASAAPPFAVFAAGAVLLGWQSLRVHTFLPDEYIYITQARQVARRFPEALFDDRLFYLGFERLHEVLQAAAIATLPPTEAFMAGRLIPAAAFASAALPAWLLARGIGLERLPAAVAAAAAVAGPWVALSTTFLNEPVAYPAVVWAVWGIWRSAVRAGPANDALALALVAVAGLSRSSMIVVGGALPLTVVAQELRFATRGSIRERLRAVAAALWRRHGVLVAALAAALIWVLFLGGVESARGYYAASLLPEVHQLRLKSQLLGLMLAEGLLLVTFVFALAWIVRTIVRGDDSRTHAFVVASVAATALIAYSAAAVSAVQEERYLFYAVPFVAICAIAGVVRRELPFALVGALGAGVVLLVVVSPPFVEIGPYDHISSAGRALWRRVVLGRIYSHAPGELGEQADVIAASTLALVGTGVAYALNRGGRAGHAAAVGTLAAILVVGVLSAGYAMNRYVTGAGEPDGPGFEDRTLLYRTLGRDAFYKYLDGTGEPTDPPLWRDVAFWNGSFQHAYIGYGSLEPAVSSRTGRIGNADSTLLTPELVTVDQYRPVGLAATHFAGAARIDVYRLARPYQARWLELGGVEPNGVLSVGGRAGFRIFGRGLEPSRPHCLRLLAASGGGTELAARSGGRSTRVDLPAGGTVRALYVPLPGLVERGWRDVRLRAGADVTIVGMSVRGCAPAT